jgi:hypothetical protein
VAGSIEPFGQYIRGCCAQCRYWSALGLLISYHKRVGRCRLPPGDFSKPGTDWYTVESFVCGAYDGVGHHCDGVPSGVRVVPCGNVWQIETGHGLRTQVLLGGIKVCPYCGEKLE